MFHYTVTAQLQSQDALDRYLDWLKNGHVQALLPWAVEARVILLDPSNPNHLPKVQSAYLFQTRADFERYQQEGAPLLQSEGKQLARDLGGIEFTRSFGTCLMSVKAPS